MYTSEQLARYPFFRELMQSVSLEEMHDSLTGTLARPYLFRFLRSLFEEKRPFMLAIVDLDNFKSINDNYGHRTGDDMLSSIGADLCGFVGESGVVGRFGGDEFMLVYFGDTGYDPIHAFFDAMYAKGGVFRKNLVVRGRTIFSTATIGCAVCPKDADSFEGLFALVDKALYRGKSKGRNCFIIYVPEKHAHLEIPALARRSLYDSFRHIAEAFDAGEDVADSLGRAFVPLREGLRMYKLLFLDAENRLYDAESGGLIAECESPAALVVDGLYTARSLDTLGCACPGMTAVLSELGFESVLISEVKTQDRLYGYLLFCPEIHTLHIWQEDECACAFFLSHMLARRLDGEGARVLR